MCDGVGWDREARSGATVSEERAVEAIRALEEAGKPYAVIGRGIESNGVQLGGGMLLMPRLRPRRGDGIRPKAISDGNAHSFAGEAAPVSRTAEHRVRDAERGNDTNL